MTTPEDSERSIFTENRRCHRAFEGLVRILCGSLFGLGRPIPPEPECPVITIRQPWASLIALGLKDFEYRRQRTCFRGAVIIHAASQWYKPEGLRYGPSLRSLILEHFSRYTSDPDMALDAMFPLSVPVADAVVTDCQPSGEYWAIKLDEIRIITRPTPLNGLLSVPWVGRVSQELAESLKFARMLEGREKDLVYREFQLLGLRAKINVWLRDNGRADFAMKARGRVSGPSRSSDEDILMVGEDGKSIRFDCCPSKG